MKSTLFLLGAVLVFGVCTQAMATNGMNMIAYDAVSAGMGGADVALESGCTAVAANPANLSTLCKSSVVGNLSLLMPSISFANTTMSGPNNLDGESQAFPLPFLGYASTLGQSGLAWGIGLFAQGGMGVDIKDARTNFMTEDAIYSNVRYMRLAPTLAYPVTERLSLGLTGHIGYSDVAYDFFPETSFYDPGPDQTPQTADDLAFPGQSLEGASSIGFAFRLGGRFEATDDLTFGATYTSKSSLDYEDGDLDMNMTAMGLGKVRYDASVDGFTWPAAAEVGLAYKAMDKRLTLAADVQWINWVDALETVTVMGTAPDNENAPPEVEVLFQFDWDDQIVYAVGAGYAFTERDIARVGFNFGNNPVPDGTVYPLFPAIVESHVTVGYGRTVGQFLVDVAYEHGLSKDVTNSTADPMVNPFGPDDDIGHLQNTVHFTVTYRLAN